MVLVLHVDVEGDVLVLRGACHGVREPGGQRVGIDANGQARGRVLPTANGGQRVGLAQCHFACMPVQRLPGFGGCAGRGAAHQHLAHAFFEQLHTLRNRRAGDVQHGSRALEAALINDGSKSVELGRVKVHVA